MENNNFDILALVAIVAVIGVVSLVMMVNVAPQKNSSENLAGNAYRLSYDIRDYSSGPSWHATNCETAVDANGNTYQTGAYGESYSSSIPCSVWY